MTANTNLIVLTSHPLTVASFAVAIWEPLWWGFHRPVVNFGWPLPSRRAESMDCVARKVFITMRSKCNRTSWTKYWAAWKSFFDFSPREIWGESKNVERGRGRGWRTHLAWGPNWSYQMRKSYFARLDFVRLVRVSFICRLSIHRHSLIYKGAREPDTDKKRRITDIKILVFPVHENK